MRRELFDDVVIEASPAAVWSALTNLAGWSAWNPVYTQIEGELETACHLDATLALPARRARRVAPEVMRVLPEQELSWIMRVLVPGLLDCEHRFMLESVSGGETGAEHTRVVQRVRISGILLPFLWRRLRQAVAQGLQRSNRGLREVVLERTA